MKRIKEGELLNPEHHASFKANVRVVLDTQHYRRTCEPKDPLRFRVLK